MKLEYHFLIIFVCLFVGDLLFMFIAGSSISGVLAIAAIQALAMIPLYFSLSFMGVSHESY